MLIRTLMITAVGFFAITVPSFADRPGGGCIEFDTVIASVPALISNDGIANSIIHKLSNAEAAFMAGDTNASVGVLIALDHEITAQSGKGLDDLAAGTLQADVQGLIEYVMNPDE
jgi:hypothetical protein